MVRAASPSSLCIRALVAATALLFLGSALYAQDAPAPPQTPAIERAPTDPPPPAEHLPPSTEQARRPGVFEAIGRWFDERGASLRRHWSGAKSRMDSLGEEAVQNSREIGSTAADAGRTVMGTAVEATKGAVDAVAKLPGTRMTKGHERCGVAPNGAPDCVAAADALCRKHGFSSGKSMDFTSAEECTASAYLAGRQSEPECRTVTFISRAMCQ